MSFRDDLAKVIAGNSRHSIEAYAFVLEALQLARSRKLRALARERKGAGERRSRGAKAEGDSLHPRPKSGRRPEIVGHVTGQEFCESARRLALRQFGFLAGLVLKSWGIRSTSDLGDVVYSLIASGHLEKTSDDSQSDFEDVFNFETAFRPTLAAIAREARIEEDGAKPGPRQ